MRSSSTPHVRTFLWPQKPSWTVRLKPRGFYSLSALGGQTLALWGSTLPKASVCPSCLLASITISWTSQLHSRLPTQAALRTGKSEQHLHAAGHGWDIAPRPRNGAFTCLPQTPGRTDCRTALQILLSRIFPTDEVSKF